MSQDSHLDRLSLPPVFSRKDALGRGLAQSALESPRVSRELYGYYSRSGFEVNVASVARAVVAKIPRSFVSHQTAALIHGISLPQYVDLEIPWISRERGSRALRVAGIRSCSVKHVELDTAVIDGTLTSTPARLFLEMARELSHEDLVALGDQIVRVPRKRYEGRSEPFATRGDLHEMLLAHPRSPGKPPALRAFRLVRVGADSVPETRMRLAIVAHGLPEPHLQVLLDPQEPDSWSADLGYPDLKIALQYDGDPHLDPDRQYRDNVRDSAFSSAGWIVIKANRRDLANGFVRIRAELRNAFATRGVSLAQAA